MTDAIGTRIMSMLRLSKDEFSTLFGKKTGKPEEPKRQKYGNKRCEWMGILFDSKRERDRYIVLDAALRDGQITDLRRQVRFLLIPKLYYNGKLTERETYYIADFTYRDGNGNLVVEDAKGFRRNATWILKRKLMLMQYGIKVEEV